jgi:antirestriction protein ArdC
MDYRIQIDYDRAKFAIAEMKKRYRIEPAVTVSKGVLIAPMVKVIENSREVRCPRGLFVVLERDGSYITKKAAMAKEIQDFLMKFSIRSEVVKTVSWNGR